MKLVHGAILMVADGTKMLLLRNEGDAVDPDLAVFEHRQFENPPNRELMSDAPGLGFSTGHPGRSTFEEADPHRQNQEAFAAAAAGVLANVARDNPACLIVIAPPDTLGVLRRHYDRNVKAKLLAEIPKDLTKHPVSEITRLIEAHQD